MKDDKDIEGILRPDYRNRKDSEYRNYKDNVFCLLYNDKNNLLDLYNGLNGTSYSDTDGLIITTLKNGVYVKYKNDASFVLGQDLYMFEQQSTKNPNMPLRYLHYLSDVYRGMYTNKDLYRSGLKIPYPHFITFYNGLEYAPAEEYLRLSDMFESNTGKDEHDIDTSYNLELVVRVININNGNNNELLSKCQTLRDYMTFVDKVRYKKNTEKKDIELAVNEAVDECIQEDVLSDFFKNHRDEVVRVSIYEYDEEGHIEVLKEEQFQKGFEAGIINAIISMIELGIDKDKILTKYTPKEYETAMEQLKQQP